MSLPTTSEDLQQELAALKLYRAKVDGDIGQKSLDALREWARSLPSEKGRILSSPGWSWTARVEGGDIVVENASATWFGGDRDPLDNGETASGILTKGHPDLIGCSLPMDFGDRVPNTKGSPLPKIRWQTTVYVTRGEKTLACPLIDVGPARWAGDQIDLTIAAFQALGGTIKQGVIKDITYRIAGGAQYLA